MHLAILAVGGFVIAWIVLRSLAREDPALLARRLRAAAFIVLAAAGMFVLSRGLALVAGLLFALSALVALGLLRPSNARARAGADTRRARDHVDMTVEEALDILGLPPDADARAIRQAHRARLKANHPDKGGSAEAAAKINRARDVLLGPR